MKRREAKASDDPGRAPSGDKGAACCTDCCTPLQAEVQHADPTSPPTPKLAQLWSEMDQNGPGLWLQLIDTMAEGLLVVGPDRRVVYVNHHAEKMIGRSLEQIRGLRCTDAIDCPQCQCRCRLFEDGGADACEVTIIRHNDAHHRTLRKNARILRDPNGQILGGVETFSDITAEKEQRQENERYTSLLFREKTRCDALLEAVDDPVFAVDASLHVLSCSSKFAEILGKADASEVVGVRLPELLGLDPSALSFGPALDHNEHVVTAEIGRDHDKRACTLSFRRVRLSDDELLGVLRLGGDPARTSSNRRSGDRFQGIVSQSPRMWEIFRTLECVAQNQSNVLIEGESGVGKELVAQAIHRLGPRCEEPFYAINCATFTGGLLLSELFGHERGAFTGAFRASPGKLEMAGNGTLFLDEVSEIPLHYQSVLLRVLEQRHFERVGGRKRIEMRARLVAATNQRLAEAVQAKRFRDDLYFRLKVIPIQIPPLRERREDIPLLARYFAALPAANLSGKRIGFTDAALEVMGRYSWPGNVRELRNLVEYLCFTCDGTVDSGDLPRELREEQPPPVQPSERCSTPAASSAASQRSALERARVLEALQRAGFRQQEAAESLGIDRTTLWRKRKRLGI